MEILGGAIGAILIEPCRFVFGYVQASTNNFFKRKSNFNALKNDIMSPLTVLKKEVQEKLNLKDEQSAVVLASQVRDWVSKVDKFETKMDEFQSTISTSDRNNLQDSCCPFPLQCNLSNKLAKKIKEANLLMDAGKDMLDKMGDMRDKTKPVEHIPGPSIIGQKTASENLARVLDLLSDDNVTRIGVCGMGGVGKTTLVRNLNNELGKTPAAQYFSVIIWVTVSKDTTLKRIQTRIAKRLNLEVKDEPDEESMASRIHERLLMERRFLLILDDVWEEIDLDKVGIPRPELCPRSKIIITTRKLDVCRGMDTQIEIQMKALNEEEAWELFSEHAGEVVMEEHIKPVAKMVSKECDGLPLAIIVVGRSMKRKSKIELWKAALEALRKSVPIEKGITDKVFRILEPSYDSIEDRNTKFCFLFCCLYPEDFEIEVDELVRYWFCEGLLDERQNYEAIRNRGIAIIHSLRDFYLLEEGYSENTVKMHDVIRDFGIWIAESREDECKSLVRSGFGLTSLSDTNFSSYKRLSFMNNQIASLPDCVVQCEEVSTLFLQGNKNLDTVPASFLQGFQTLKILNLSRSNITSLPSLLQLDQLQALILSRCPRLTELPPLDGQSRLLLLDCRRSGLRKLPESLEKLSNLRQLDISYCTYLETIPYSAISKLSNLESLKLFYAGGKHKIEGQSLFEVLLFLKQLTVLHTSLYSVPHLRSNNANWFQRIKDFRIVIVQGDHVYDVIDENGIVIIDVSLCQESIGWLLCNAKILDFSGCQGLTEMFIKLVTANVIYESLKILKISRSDISFGGGVATSFDLLPNLEEISLYGLSELKVFSDLSKLLGLRFSRLKWIRIKSCEKLKCVFSLEESQSLEKLEMIYVSDCKMLINLFDYPNPRAQHMKAAPNLQSVTLRWLPNLENLWGTDESSQNVRELEFLNCPKIRKLPLTAQNAESIKEISGEEEWWNGLEWDSEDTKMLLQQRFQRIWT